jgi:hypothetical protein
MFLAGLVPAAALSRGKVVVVATRVVSVVVGPAEPAPPVETWLSVLVEPSVPVLELVLVTVGAGLVPVVVGAATWAVVVGPAPPLLAISGTTMAAATMTAPATAMPTTRERRRPAPVRATSGVEWRGW